jgi:hypothetical protein
VRHVRALAVVGTLLDERSGAGLLVAPWEGPLDPPIAFRAWGVQAQRR